MKTATPPKGVTARWVSRRITRSPESRAVISCGTGLSEVLASTPLYRKYLRAEYSSASEFRISARTAKLPRCFVHKRCTCGRCARCLEEARWDRVFQIKSADTAY